MNHICVFKNFLRLFLSDFLVERAAPLHPVLDRVVVARAEADDAEEDGVRDPGVAGDDGEEVEVARHEEAGGAEGGRSGWGDGGGCGGSVSCFWGGTGSGAA